MDIVLQTKRLLLRTFSEEDVDNLVELDSDPAVLEFINGGAPTPRDVVEEQILPRFMQERGEGYGYFATHERSSGEFVGWFCLHPEEGEPEGTAALGYRLRRSAWGKGYATEGARALVRRGFSELGMQRVIATTYEHNRRSWRVMEKVGMRLVRRYRPTVEELAAGGTFVFNPDEVWEGDDVAYALDRTEWERLDDSSDGA